MENEHLQIILYTSYLHCIGGIETFIINFIDIMKDHYSIGVICPQLDNAMSPRITSRAKLLPAGKPVSCDNLIMIRQGDRLPHYISYQKSIRMCHSCKSFSSSNILQDCDEIVHVSEASKASYGTSGKVIHNPLIVNPKKALLFVSATRIPARDKGENTDRMLLLARKLEEAKIPYLWFNFSDAPLKNAPKNLVNVGTMQDLQPYISKADYLIQLSDHEGFGMSVLEALVSGTAVLCTEFETVHELGVVDGENGYIVPFDLNFDLKKLLNVPQFKYDYDNTKILNQWKKILSKKSKKPRKLLEDMVKIQVVVKYKDMQLDKWLVPGTITYFTRKRAEEVKSRGYIRILEG